jgi:hypothetical protein
MSTWKQRLQRRLRDGALSRAFSILVHRVVPPAPRYVLIGDVHGA